MNENMPYQDMIHSGIDICALLRGNSGNVGDIGELLEIAADVIESHRERHAMDTDWPDALEAIE